MRTGKDFPVVCVGGSSGGLEAYKQLLQHLPSNLGIAVVIVNHMRSVETGPAQNTSPLHANAGRAHHRRIKA